MIDVLISGGTAGPVVSRQTVRMRAADLLRIQTVRYLFVGGLCTALDVGLFNVFVFAASVDPVFAKISAGAVAVIVSFVLNKTWTFASSTDGVASRQFTFYVGVNAISAIVSVGCLQLAERLELSGLVWTNIAAFSVVLIFGTVARFLVYRRWVFGTSA